MALSLEAAFTKSSQCLEDKCLYGVNIVNLSLWEESESLNCIPKIDFIIVIPGKKMTQDICEVPRLIELIEIKLQQNSFRTC